MAGPGSGKTRVIVHRIAYLIKVCGVPPFRVAAVTFTNKAAREMRERLAALLGARAEDLTVGTFHKLCASILRRDGGSIGLDQNFVIYDEDEQLTVVKRAMDDLGINPESYAPRAAHSAIEAAKSHLIGVAEHARSRMSYRDEVVHRIYERYEELLQRSKAVDFADLIFKAVRLLQEHPDILAKYQDRYTHFMVDEFQDTDIAQYLLVRQLAAKSRNICVVGDPDQSIYSWRYADIRNILNFEKDYPEAKVVILEQNYRSTKTILEAADHLIAPNQQRKEKRLWTDNDKGPPITVMETYSEQEEAKYVVNEVERLTASKRSGYGDFAVMYRTNAQSRALEEAFMRYGIPYRLVGALRFYQRKEVKDLIAYLRVVHNPYDDVSLTRIVNLPPRGIGQKTWDELTRWARDKSVPLYTALQLLVKDDPFLSSRAKPPLMGVLNLIDELLQEAESLDVVRLFNLVLQRSGYKEWNSAREDGDERWENLLELRAVASEYEDLPPKDSLSSFLEGVALVSDVDNLEEKREAVTLTTLHQAKGLEFPVVFITGMEEGLLPHSRSFDDPAQMEEERRLCYVGTTRAKELLYLVRAFRRSSRGSNTVSTPSRFLKDIPTHLIHNPRQESPKAQPTPATDRWVSSTTPRPKATPFSAGDRVRHAKFGEGIVVSCKKSAEDQEVTVAFKGGTGVKKLLLSFAPLEKVQ